MTKLEELESAVGKQSKTYKREDEKGSIVLSYDSIMLEACKLAGFALENRDKANSINDPYGAEMWEGYASEALEKIKDALAGVTE